MKKNLFVFLTIILIPGLISCEKEKEDEQERFYTTSIERNFANDFEKNLIEKAEAFYPEREKVTEVADLQLEIPDSNYWYYSSFDGVYIPYALTRETINYYSNLIDEFNQNKSENFFIYAEFLYTASVTFYENYQSPSENSTGESVTPSEFDAVYVVELIMEWNQYCGPLCAMWINKMRIVVFDEEGNLLDVFLDGPVSVAVS